MVEVHRKIVRNPDLCTGCSECERACSFHHTGSFDPLLSRIRIQSQGEEKSPFPFFCLNCEKPQCVEICPTDSLSKDPETGIVVWDEDSCVLCGECISSCPNAGIFFNDDESTILSCDLCGGEPACVEVCTPGALTLRDIGPLWKKLHNSEDLVSPGIAACQGCGGEWVLRFALKVLGRNTVIGLPPCCMSATGLVGFGTNTGAKIPITFTHLGNAASMMAGVKHHFQRQKRDVTVVAFAGDGGTADIGLQGLSAAAERGDNIIYICYDNEAYMNTGIQRSGTTPRGAWTTTTPVGEVSRGKKQKNKDMPFIMLMHELPYMATASCAYPEDFMAKLEKAKEVKNGLVYIHVFAPCPIGWRFPSQNTMKVARLAVETNFFPLWEAGESKIRLTKEVKFPKPIEAYTKTMGRYKHLTTEELQEMQKATDDHYKKLSAFANHQTN